MEHVTAPGDVAAIAMPDETRVPTTTSIRPTVDRRQHARDPDAVG